MTEKELTELSNYAELEGCELGEVIENFLLPARLFSDYLSGEFLQALNNELKRLLDQFRRYYIIKEEQKTSTQTYVTLEII